MATPRLALLVIASALAPGAHAAEVAGTRTSAITVCAEPFCRTTKDTRYYVEIAVLVTGDRELDAVGFDVDYPPFVRYLGIGRGAVTREWFDFQASWSSPNHVRIGGFDGTGTTLQGTDTLCTLDFEAISYGQSTLRLHSFVDDLEGAEECTTPIASRLPTASETFIAVVPKEAPASCCFETPDGTALLVVARHPQGTGGILATGFRIQVSPPAPEAFFTWTPAPGVTSSGEDPMDNGGWSPARGVAVALESCAALDGDGATLGTITVKGLSGAHELLVKSMVPMRSDLGCFFVQACEPCPGDFWCLGSWDTIVYRAVVNSNCWPPCGRVPVAAVTWGAVKAIYRD